FIHFFSFYCSYYLRVLHSFPTRRSSDLSEPVVQVSGFSVISGLIINGKAIYVTGQPNQTISLLGGIKIIINEQSMYADAAKGNRSEEHTSELQSRFDLVCRLLLEKKKNK